MGTNKWPTQTEAEIKMTLPGRMFFYVQKLNKTYANGIAAPSMHNVLNLCTSCMSQECAENKPQYNCHLNLRRAHLKRTWHTLNICRERLPYVQKIHGPEKVQVGQ